MVRSLDLDDSYPATIFLRPLLFVIVAIPILFVGVDFDPLYSLLIGIALVGESISAISKYFLGSNRKHNFLLVDNLVTYTCKKGYEIVVSEEIYLNELILKEVSTDYSDECPYVLLKSTDDSFKLEIDLLQYKENRQNFIDFLSLKERLDEDGDPMSEWRCSTFDESSLPSISSDQEIEASVGNIIFLTIFSLFWIPGTAIINVALLFFDHDLNIIYTLMFLTPFNLFSAGIVILWVKILSGRNRKEAPLFSDTSEQADTTIELRAISSSKQDIKD